MLSTSIMGIAVRSARSINITAGKVVIRCLSSTDTGKREAPNLPGLSPEQIRRIGETDTSLRTRHIQIEGVMSDEERDIARRKRMIYRSKQRGWLEADLLLGSWAVENVPGLNAEELDQYEEILKVETIDVYNYISMKDIPPDHLKDLSLMKRLQAFALRRDMVAPEGYAAVKRNSNLT